MECLYHLVLYLELFPFDRFDVASRFVVVDLNFVHFDRFVVDQD